MANPPTGLESTQDSLTLTDSATRTVQSHLDPAVGFTKGSTQSTQSTGPRSAAAPPQAPVPAVFADQSVVATLPPDEQAEISRIAGDFASAMEHSGLEPSDGGYADRWNRAVESADQEFESLYGIDAFNAMQIAR